MEILKKKTIGISSAVNIFLALLLNLIIFSTNNKLMMYTKHISLIAIIVCLFGVFALKKEWKIKVNKFKILYILFVTFICFSLIYVKNSTPILEYSIYFVLGLCIICSDFEKTFYFYFLKIFKLLFWIFILSMFLEAGLPGVFHLLFDFASFGDAEMRSVTSGGAVAGLAFEKAYAAFLCNLGLGIILAEFVLKKSFRNILQLSLVMIALMMTGKRTLFIIPIAIFLVYVILFSKNNRFVKFAIAGLIMVLFILVIYMVIPSAALIINRFLDSGGDILSGRENFWKYAMEMFHSSPILGTGFLSFNEYVYKQGFRYYGEMWNYQAHNVYIQLLGETGIIGFTIMVALIILLVIRAVMMAKRKKNFWNVLLVYWIVLFGIYGITGNTLYYPCQLIILFLCILFVSNEQKMNDIFYKNKVIKFRF